MTISQSAWQQAQYDFLEDLLSLWLPPTEPFAIAPNYPKSSSLEALIKDRCGNLHVPQKTLALVDDLLDSYTIKQGGEALADWAVLFEFELLQGFGHNLSCDMKGPTFEGLKQLATTWGLYWANKMKNSMLRWEVVSTVGVCVADMWVELFRQLPSKELGDAVRESVTPAYIRAGETVSYNLALLNVDRREQKKALDILQASDADLNREIKDMLGRHSSREVATELQQKVVEMAIFLKDLYHNEQFAEEFQAALPASLRFISWFIGYRLRQNLQCDPQRMTRLLEAISRHQEITAAMEQYRCKHGWGGDENMATSLVWQVVAPKYFHLSRNMMDVHEDEAEEKLIGVAQGLKDYTSKHPAIDALADGFVGKLGAYLKSAGENEGKDYLRKQRRAGNRALIEAEHAEDLRFQGEEGDERLSDDEILSREKERFHPSRDSVIEELESKEAIKEWYSLLTEREKTVANLKSDGYMEEEIATTLGISQQRVSQLLSSGRAKYFKTKNSS